MSGPRRRNRRVAVLAVPLFALVAGGAAPAAQASAQPPRAGAAPVAEVCLDATVTGGTLSLCDAAAGTQAVKRLTFTNPGRARRDLSVVVYDCAVFNPGIKCQDPPVATYTIEWRQVRSKESVSADLQLKNPLGPLVYWTADPDTQATALQLADLS
ncbi:hypothetical protein [Streptomyces clavuligerus]|nr:hypothetical protein [Streptomyces clavuligerus]WDN56461.1 hypothetical protein LL058_31985 [Streptomyces clavuligerus]